MAELVRTGELKRFLPHQVAEGLLAGRLTSDGGFERRKLTLLFADMVGFTDLSDTLAPEELSDVLNEYLREMAAVAVEHGGTLDNFIGDGIMVLFGAPIRADESEQAWAALRAAFEMKERVETLSEATRAWGIPADLKVRVGVNTGHCTVGVFGSDVLRAYKAVGFEVNVAARLQSEAEPGTPLVGFRTYALVKDRVRAEKREPLSIKGRPARWRRGPSWSCRTPASRVAPELVRHQAREVAILRLELAVAVTSIATPCQKRGLPSSSRTSTARLSSQTTRPSGRTMRNSSLNGSPVCSQRVFAA